MEWVCIEHAPSCPVSRDDFMPVEGVQQCNCDFGQRLKAYFQKRQSSDDQPENPIDKDGA